jgi:hypothetical protein
MKTAKCRDVVCSFRRGIAVRGKQAKILSDGSLEDLLLFADQPHPLRNNTNSASE